MELRTSRRTAFIAALFVAASAAASAATNYRSIGSAGSYSVGTVRVVNGQPHVFGDNSALWRSANRGKGDRITIAGVDYTVLSVDAENEITLTAPYAGPSAAGVTYVISRQFQELRAWEECISAQVACPGVLTSDFVVDDRSEVGVVYKDSVFLMNAGTERLVIDGSTTDAAHTITLSVEVSNRHFGIAGTGVVLDNGSYSTPAIEIRDDFVTVEWLEIRNGGNTSQILVTNVSPANQIVARHLVLHDDDRSTNGIATDSNDVHLLAYNNVAYGVYTGVYINNLQIISTAAIEIFHNTFFGNSSGVESSTSAANRNDVILLKNNLSMGCIFRDYWAPTPNSASSYNFSSDTQGPAHSPGGGGVGSLALASVRFVSTTPGAEDLHIRSGSSAENAAPALVQVPDDIDAGLRTSPDVGADEATTSTVRPVRVITATASMGRVKLEWQNPVLGPIDRVEVRRSTAALPALPTDGGSMCIVPTPARGSKSTCADGGVTDGTTYFYAAFVFDAVGNFSMAKGVTARPFDTTTELPEWAYTTAATTLAPAGLRYPSTFLVSNDNFVHAMQGGVSPTKGEWPTSGSPAWIPYQLGQPAQHRPAVLAVGGQPAALIGALDGRVYAVHADTGRLLWKSQPLGGQILAAPAALIGAFGASGLAADTVYVGTGDGSSNSLAILDLNTGALLGRFDDGGAPANVGAVSGITVQYPSGPVVFTSDIGSGGSPRSVWVVDVTDPSSPAELWSDNLGPVDAGPTMYRGKLFVGSRAGDLYAYDAAAGPPWLWRIPYGDGAVKTPIFPVWQYDTLLFATGSELHSVQFEATGGCGSPPCLNWTLGFGTGTSGVMQVPGTDHAFVGLANGELREITVDRNVPTTLPTSRAFPVSGFGLGSTSLDIWLGMIYVGDNAGKVYGVTYPIP